MASTPLAESASAARRKVPDNVVDRNANREYVVGKFLGKGAFAKCYEFVDKETEKTFAAKIVSKALLSKSNYKDKMTQEIQIHRSLSHHHIVGFQACFEDDKNVYIIMELCNGSLAEMQRRRKTLTEAEVRYFLHQLLLACRYLVQQRVIHRDLKLRNLLLNENMQLKVADFGLATRVDYVGERKKTLCGTPNYIAPEVLAKTGHSFEVDVWSIGCIMFTLLVGKAPFESSTLKETYTRIRKNEFQVPSTVSSPARALIQRMLQLEPESRPCIDDIMQDDFFTCGPLPSLLPKSCLVTEPRFDTLNASLRASGRRVLLDLNDGGRAASPGTAVRCVPAATELPSPAPRGGQREAHLKELRRLLHQLCSIRPPERYFELPDEVEDPGSVPVFWISKWVDYTDKYGLGYQLCDDSIGVLFNDNTRMMRLNNQVSMTYVDGAGLEHYHTLDEYPPSLLKKVTLLKHFCGYMKQNLLALGEVACPRECDDLVRLPCLGTWLRTRSAISFYLTNGTVQVNFFHDHTKIILCPLVAAVTYVDSDRAFHTYRLATLEQGCPPQLFSRLKYARTIVDRLADASS